MGGDESAERLVEAVEATTLAEREEVGVEGEDVGTVVGGEGRDSMLDELMEDEENEL